MLHSPRLSHVAVLSLFAGVTGCRVQATGILDSGAPECVNNAQCALPGAGVCDLQIGKCFQCVVNTDCPANNDCTAHACVAFSPCTAPTDCSSGTCDTAAGRCVQCLGDTDCSGAQRCVEKTCRAQCGSADDCSAIGQLCDLNSGTCVACLTHADCPAEQYCSSGACKPDECQGGQTACIDNGVATCKPDGDGFAAPQTCIASSCVLSGTGARCETAPADAGGTDTSTGIDAGGTDTSVGTDSGTPQICGTTASDYACDTIPRFPIPSSSQVLDGDGTEFLPVRPVVFTAMNAPFREGHSNGDPPPSGSFPEQITFRAAWSPEAFHLHVRVTDTALYPNTTDGSYWDGDAVDVLIASTDTFSYGGSATCDATAMQLEVIPTSTPTGTIYASGSGSRSLPTEWFATRVLAGEAYEIEFRIPWQSAPAALASGSKIGFHLGVSIQDQAGSGRQLWVTLPLQYVSKEGGGCAGLTIEQAWCDGRAWCRPTLSDLSCP